MKKTISVISFAFSTILFTYLLIVLIGFIVTLIQNPVLDIMDATITILVHAGTILITSVLGLPFAIISVKSFANKIIRICSNVEIVFFLIGIIFSVFQLFVK